MSLPECFCWTRFGTEAGQSASQILARKEQERSANRGVFFWGIGNAIGPSMLELLRQTDTPQALFSPIRSAPRQQDATPSTVVSWNEASTLDGERYQLPHHSLITSRFDHIKPRSKHYALVCYSEAPLIPDVAPEQLHFAGLRNLLTDRPVGASQVTAVVRLRQTLAHETGPTYRVALRVQLRPPYFIVLSTPKPLMPSEEPRSWEAAVARGWNAKRKLATQ